MMDSIIWHVYFRTVVQKVDGTVFLATWWTFSSPFIHFPVLSGKIVDVLQLSSGGCHQHILCQNLEADSEGNGSLKQGVATNVEEIRKNHLNAPFLVPFLETVPSRAWDACIQMPGIPVGVESREKFLVW